MFQLDPRLKRDCIELGSFKLSLILLMNDSNYPWFILVPRREGLTELYELSPVDRLQFHKESLYFSEELARFFTADKMNVAALGNMVPQLHVHHIVRYKNDPAWPSPVWGAKEAVPYEPEKVVAITSTIKSIVENFSN